MVLCFCWFLVWISVLFGLCFLGVNDVVMVEVSLAPATTPTVKGGCAAVLYGGGSGGCGDMSGGGGCHRRRGGSFVMGLFFYPLGVWMWLFRHCCPGGGSFW
jgi:hypothetical protein